jgi:hypothetical protein
MDEFHEITPNRYIFRALQEALLNQPRFAVDSVKAISTYSITHFALVEHFLASLQSQEAFSIPR